MAHVAAITGLSAPQLLNASHIVPWAVDVKNRTNPRNGLCLNALHDRSFDCGLITVTPDLKVRVSPRLKNSNPDTKVLELFVQYEGLTIAAPSHFAPSPEFLHYHNEHVFQGGR